MRKLFSKEPVSEKGLKVSAAEARKALATAIARAENARDEVIATESAIAKAKRQVVVAMEVLEQSKTSRVNSQALSESLIGSMRSGGDGDVSDLARIDPDISIGEAQRNVELWEKTLSGCKEALKEKNFALQMAELPVRDVVGLVLRAEFDCDALIASIQATQAALLEKRTLLAFLTVNRVLSDAQLTAVHDLMQEQLPTARVNPNGAESFVPASARALYGVLDQAREDLSKNANAPLPEFVL